MSSTIAIVLAVLCNTAAQGAMKAANGAQDFTGTAWMIAALAAYGLSFWLTLRVYAITPLSVASPVMAGATFVLVTLISAIAFGESINALKLAGIACIALGIALLARSA